MFIKIFLFIFLITLNFTTQANNFFSGTGKITYVVDGDTMDIKTSRKNLNKLIDKNLISQNHVNYSNRTFRVRLANVDTEESVHVDKSKNTERGAETSNYVKSLASYEQTSFECYDKGYYGRGICSITVNGEDLGYHLIKSGHSTYLTSFGNHPTMHWKYRRAQAESIAKKANGYMKENNIGEKINDFRSNLLN